MMARTCLPKAELARPEEFDLCVCLPTTACCSQPQKRPFFFLSGCQPSTPAGCPCAVACLGNRRSSQQNASAEPEPRRPPTSSENPVRSRPTPTHSQARDALQADPHRLRCPALPLSVLCCARSARGESGRAASQFSASTGQVCHCVCAHPRGAHKFEQDQLLHVPLGLERPRGMRRPGHVAACCGWCLGSCINGRIQQLEPARRSTPLCARARCDRLWRIATRTTPRWRVPAPPSPLEPQGCRRDGHASHAATLGLPLRVQRRCRRGQDPGFRGV